MGFLKFLFLGTIGYFIARVLRTFAASSGPERPRKVMVRCATCGVYVLEDRALATVHGAPSFCSPECAAR